MEKKGKVKVVDKRFQGDVNLPAVPMSALELAINKGADIAVIEKMMELQERHEANEARKAYHEAMAKFKADPPKILKDKLVDFTSSKGRTKYWISDLAPAAEKINIALSKHGLSAGWKTEQPESLVKVTCTITHRLGHSESTSMQAPADATGNKNAIQALGSTVTYLSRYTLMAITGLAPEGMDDDGRGAIEPITEAQVKTIKDLITAKYGKKSKGFFDWLALQTGANAIDTIPAKDFKIVQTALRNVKDKPAEKPKDTKKDPTEKQVIPYKQIYAMGKKEYQMTSVQVKEFADWYKGGEHMTESEAKTLIANFDKAIENYWNSPEYARKHTQEGEKP